MIKLLPPLFTWCHYFVVLTLFLLMFFQVCYKLFTVYIVLQIIQSRKVQFVHSSITSTRCLSRDILTVPPEYTLDSLAKFVSLGVCTYVHSGQQLLVERVGQQCISADSSSVSQRKSDKQRRAKLLFIDSAFYNLELLMQCPPACHAPYRFNWTFSVICSKQLSIWQILMKSDRHFPDCYSYYRMILYSVRTMLFATLRHCGKTAKHIVDIILPS